MFVKYSFPTLELLQDSFDPPATVESLHELEFDMGVKLPKEYFEFLLKHNGGDFKQPVMFYVENTSNFPQGVTIESFFGDHNLDSSGNLRWYAETFENRIPYDRLAVADCGGLDLVMLSMEGPSFEPGKVWFWDGTEEGEGNNIYWLANSFNEFLAMLQFDTYYEPKQREKAPLFQAVEQGKLRAVEEYLGQGGNPEARNARGLTLVAAAAKYSWPKIVRLLLDHSADPNARDMKGRARCTHAASSSIDSVKLLLAAGADATARDRKGRGVPAGWSYRADQILRAHGAQE
jgi:hypothetical protein